MLPYNPKGKLRFPAGWTAHNAALNVSLAFIEFDETGVAFLPEDCLMKEEE